MPERIWIRFCELKQYVGWSERDDLLSSLLLEIISGHQQEIVDDFYNEIMRHPAAARVITGGDEQVLRLKGSLKRWLIDFVAAEHNPEYVARRWQIGYRHVEIGLDQTYVNAAFSRVRQQLSALVCHEKKYSEQQRMELVASLNRRLDLDLAIMSDAYQREHQNRQVPVNQARLQQQKLLAVLSEDALAGASIQQLIEKGMAFLARAFNAQCCDYFELHPEHNQLRLVSGFGWPAQQMGSLTIPLKSGGQFAFLLQQKGCYEVEDLQEAVPFLPEPVYVARRIVSSLQAVVRSEGEVLGLLSVHENTRRTFTPSDQDFLLSLANLLAISIKRKRIEQQRQESEQQLRRLIDRLPAGAVYVINETMQINQAVENMTGFSRVELSSRHKWQDLILIDTPAEGPVEEIAESSLPSADGGIILQRQLKILRKDLQQRLLLQTIFHSGTDEVWLLNDITEESERQKHQLQSERLAAIGQMITGLAHESRNSLQRIQACTELLEMQLENNAEALSLLQRLQQAQDDLHQLYDEVRNYASPLTLKLQSHELAAIIWQAWAQLEPIRKNRRAELTVEIAESLPSVHVDAFRMVQVFRNFFENSLAATSDPIELRAQAKIVQQGQQRRIEIELTDNGPGFDAMVAQKMFEPFFTTKSKGSGLGMAIASRIITAHEGGICAISARSGARFQVWLPLPSIPRVPQESR